MIKRYFKKQAFAYAYGKRGWWTKVCFRIYRKYWFVGFDQLSFVLTHGLPQDTLTREQVERVMQDFKVKYPNVTKLWKEINESYR